MGKSNEELNEAFGVDLDEMPRMLKIEEVAERYFDNDKDRTTKAVGRIVERVLAYPSEGGLVLTMEDHAGLYMFLAAAKEKDNEADRKLAYIEAIAKADDLNEAMTAIVAAQLMELIK